MLKALLLQRLYALSDPQLEEALFDRLSFRRFCGFAAGEGAPDETTLCRFRQDAAESGVLEACLDEVNRQLAAKGLMLRTGTLIDATIIDGGSRPGEGSRPFRQSPPRHLSRGRFPHPCPSPVRE